MRKILNRELKKPSNREFLKLFDDIRALGSGFNLQRLGKIYRSDKSVGHSYTKHYQKHLRRFKFKKIKLLEIGVGGYSNPDLGANSLRMWKKYFPFGRIYSFDIYDKTTLQEDRIKIFKGSQVDLVFLEKVIKEIGELDIVIDDGSHINEHVIKTFEFLFPKLKDGGVYIIEDTQTSYWKDFGGDSENLKNPTTLMNYFKSLTDSINFKEFEKENYSPTYFDENIVSMYFYHNLLIITKGDNKEESNIMRNGRKRYKN